MRRIVLTAALILGLLPAASFAQEAIRIAPPAPVIERHGPPPDRGFVWVSGYHRWANGRYMWVPGRWDRPPRPRAVWVPHHWVHRHGDWVLIEGHWR